LGCSKTGESLQKVEGWKDSVHCAAWSNDGQLLALADMSGVIKVLNIKALQPVVDGS
jgi:hypothetical protein